MSRDKFRCIIENLSEKKEESGIFISRAEKYKLLNNLQYCSDFIRYVNVALYEIIISSLYNKHNKNWYYVYRINDYRDLYTELLKENFPDSEIKIYEITSEKCRFTFQISKEDIEINKDEIDRYTEHMDDAKMFGIDEAVQFYSKQSFILANLSFE